MIPSVLLLVIRWVVKQFACIHAGRMPVKLACYLENVDNLSPIAAGMVDPVVYVMSKASGFGCVVEALTMQGM